MKTCNWFDDNFGNKIILINFSDILAINTYPERFGGAKRAYSINQRVGYVQLNFEFASRR